MTYNLYINDTIGWPISAAYVRQELAKVKGKPCDVYISSLGGDVATALQIRQLFLEHGEVTAHLHGFVASAATIVATGAKTVKMGEFALFMIHKCSAWQEQWGQMNSDDIAAAIDKLTSAKNALDSIDQVIGSIYAQRTGKEVSTLAEMMKVETWLSAEEAKEQGFVDDIIPDEQPTAMTDDLRQRIIACGYPEYWDNLSIHSETRGRNNALPAYLFSKIFTARERTQYMFGSSEDTNCVFFPIYSEADEAWSNPLDYRYWGDDIYMGDDANPRHRWRDDLQTYFFRLKEGKAHLLPHTQAPGAYIFQALNYQNGEWVNEDFSVAPQPYLCYVVEQIFAALGYTLRPENNALRQGAFRNVFIANARNTENLADILPHWTVREFFENLQ